MNYNFNIIIKMELKLQSNALSKEWKVIKSYEGCYSGGKIQFTNNPDVISCLKDGNVCLFNMKSGEIIKKLKSEEVLFIII